MDRKYLMGVGDGLVRSDMKEKWDTYVSANLRSNLLKLAIKDAYSFYCGFFKHDCKSLDLDELVSEYIIELKHARELNLFKTGGVREKDHINLWCLSRVLLPALYIESGVFIGSSLHAFLKSSKLEKIIAIDPNLGKLKIAKKDIPNGVFIDDKDFSEIDIQNPPANSLVYFDDHINTAKRIIQACDKGLKYLLFDDSTGIEGTCQRLYPAVPTIPMIMNWEYFNLHDEIKWIWQPAQILELNFKNVIKKLISGKVPTNKSVQLKIDEQFIEQCKLAKSVIKRYSKIPDLGDYIPQTFPEKMVDTSKFLVELIN